MSTRVLDARDGEEAGRRDRRRAAENGNGHGGETKEVPKTDWFVAIDDKQTGPLTLEKIKEHWERGEIGPDSLCWRAGFSDWIPVTEVADLAAELAPRPAKPVMVAPVTVGRHAAGGGQRAGRVGVLGGRHDEVGAQRGAGAARGRCARRDRQLEALGGVGAGLAGERRDGGAGEASAEGWPATRSASATCR